MRAVFHVALNAVSMALFSTVVSAQSILDNCNVVITDGLKEYAVYSDSSSYLNTIFKKYCETSGERNSQSFAAGIEAVIKSIPISFTGSYGSQDEAVSNFCREFSSVFVSQTSRNIYEETIVRRAYDSFDACIALAQTGVITRHKVETTNRVNFYLAPGFSRPVTIRGINATTNVTCVGVDPTAENQAEITFNGSSVIELSNNKVLGMVCSRSGTEDEQGTTLYDEAAVTIFTDVSPNGNYTIFFPREAILAENVASRIQTTLRELREDLAEGLEDLSTRLSTTTSSHEGTINIYGNFGEEDRSFDCPSGEVITGISLLVWKPYRFAGGTLIEKPPQAVENKIRTFSPMTVTCSRY